MAHSTTPSGTPLDEFPTPENRAIANFPTSSLPPTPNTDTSKRISLLPPMASAGGPKVPLAAPTAVVPAIGNEAELALRKAKEEEERERLAWCERYNAAQPGGRGMMSISDPDYLEIMKVWRAEQAKKNSEKKKEEAEKKAREPVVKAITEHGEENEDMGGDGGVEMHRPSRAEQEQERKKMRKRERARKWLRDHGL